jgi:adenylate cyclase
LADSPTTKGLPTRGKPVDAGAVWWFWFSSSAFHVDKQLRQLNRRLPSDPRCKFCHAPFKGIGGALERMIFGKRQSNLNPNFCNMCDEAARRFPGGAEVEMSMLFADIRGSTALSETMSALEFSRLINRFYSKATKTITDEDGLIEKLAGDSVAAFWGAGFAGPDYVKRTVHVARRLAEVMRQESIPVGIGVHAGVAFFGSMGTEAGLTDIVAIGDEVNLAARIASEAAEGEIVISQQALEAAGIDSRELERRELDLKGISQPVSVAVMQGA